jgi:hypothetical protein
LRQAKEWSEMAVNNAPDNAHMHHVHALVLSASPNDFAAADAAFAHAFKLQPGINSLIDPFWNILRNKWSDVGNMEVQYDWASLLHEEAKRELKRDCDERHNLLLKSADILLKAVSVGMNDFDCLY